MKTSFYFVLWILSYPILGLLNNEFINEHSFFASLIAVWGISWLLNRIMPRTLFYERVSSMAPILEDVYTGNVNSFSRRLSREALVETIYSVYLCISTIVIAIAVFIFGINDLVALLVFGFFLIGAIARSGKLVSAYFKLKSNPTPEQTMEIADDTYKLDYAAYYESRITTSYEGMFPNRPRPYKAFQIVSIIIAALAVILGVTYTLSGIFLMISDVSITIGALAGVYSLYGSLAIYFGVKDLITTISSMTTKRVELPMEQTISEV